MPKSAYLRVYVPATESDGPVLEHLGSPGTAPVLRSGEFGLSVESSRDDAFVIDDGGIRFVCPRNPRLRMLEGVLAFHNAYSESPVATALVPEGVANRAADELDRIRSRFPGAKSHILTSPFAVPLRWFAAFDQSERRLDEVNGRLTVTFRTALTEALFRLRRAIRVLEEAGFDETIIEQVAELISWLEDFPRDAIVELDYGGVVDLFDDTELVLDESAAEVEGSLDALDRGEFEEASEFYAAAASRWAHAHALTYVN